MPESKIPLVMAKRVVLLVVPPVDELDLVGPVEVFGTANRLLGGGRKPYAVEVVTTAPDRRVEGESGLSLLAHRHYRDAGGRADSVLIVCGVGARTMRDPALFGWLRRVAATTRRLGSVCVGAFLLAGAGILDGRRATAHWRYAREFADRYPRVAVDPRPTWVQDGNIYTSAGISAGMDLALAWVEEDFGTAAALKVARELVLFLRRPGGQDQLSVALETQASHTRSMHELQVWMTEHLDQPLSVDALADRVAMSARNFARVFTREFGTSPGHYLLLVRVEAARRLLEQTDRSLEQVANASGFRSVDVMRRALLRALGTTPRRYRRHFQTPAASARMRAAELHGPLVAARREIARTARVATTSNRRQNLRVAVAGLGERDLRPVGGSSVPRASGPSRPGQVGKT
ncbi:MAG: GlxA family transcriptional regulator [Candidatus Rokubacteria bacterium]|nr:GlxA family transcriptional regulator [Candidatus Rokubacteria bacterium]